MSDKLMTAQELSEYLGISEEDIVRLVDERVLVAYRIGGELLRFRREQIDAIRPEIESRLAKFEHVPDEPNASKKRTGEMGVADPRHSETLGSRVSDFLYFNDFYIASAVLIVLLLLVIFRG